MNAFLSPFRGLGLLFRPGLKRYVFWPLLINLVIFAAMAWAGVHYFERFIAWALPGDGWLHYLEWLLWPLFVLAYLLVTFYGFTLVANLIASPFNGILAARVEEMVTGRLPDDSPTGLMGEILPAITGELGKLWYFAVRALPILVMMVIPGLNALASLLWILLGFWFLAIEYLDYPMGNHRIRPRQQRRWLRQRPLQGWAFGAAANLLMLIPVVNLAAMPASVAGATLFWLKANGQATKGAASRGFPTAGRGNE